MIDQVPTFLTVAIPILIAGVVTALWGRGILVFIFTMPLAYVFFIAHLGGFARMDHFLMAFGFGLFVMVPAAIACAVVVAIAQRIHDHRKQRSANEAAPRQSA